MTETQVVTEDRALSELHNIVELFQTKELVAYCTKALTDRAEKPSKYWSLGNQ